MELVAYLADYETSQSELELLSSPYYEKLDNEYEVIPHHYEVDERLSQIEVSSCMCITYSLHGNIKSLNYSSYIECVQVSTFCFNNYIN